jgi:CoA:oxalate CoA-transferase
MTGPDLQAPSEQPAAPVPGLDGRARGTRKLLDDVVVIDTTIALSGPFATMLLAGLGARVIHIESPWGGDPARNNAPYVGREGITLSRESDDDLSVGALARLRSKESVTLNLKTSQGRAVFLDLCRKADVLFQNFSSGTMDRLGLGYTSVRAVNPAIVYCSISGFGTGHTTEEGGTKAMDSIIQALSGAMLTSGAEGDAPVRIGLPVADLSAPLFGVIGALAALHRARQTGEGQHVDVSMLGALGSLVAVEPWQALEACGQPTRTGAGLPRLAPFGNFATTDGFIALCGPMQEFAAGLFRAMGQPELIDDPRFATRDARVRNSAVLDDLISAWTGSVSTDQAIRLLTANGTPAAEIRSPAEAMRDPILRARGEVVSVSHPRHGGAELAAPGIPIVFSDAPAGFDRGVAALGEDTDSVLNDLLGYSKGHVEDLYQQGIL